MENLIPTYSLRPFIGSPQLLPLAEREELVYRFQFIGDNIEDLAHQYRLTPSALKQWLKDKDIQPKAVKTDEEKEKFEQYTTELFNQLRLKLTGLVALNTLKNWSHLASVEEALVLQLKAKINDLENQDQVDTKELQVLVNTHNKLIDKLELVKQAVLIPSGQTSKDFVDALSKQLSDIFNSVDGDSYQLPKDEVKEDAGES